MNRTAQGANLVLQAHLFGQFQHTHKHGGHPLAVGDFVLFDALQGKLGLKVLHHNNGYPSANAIHSERQGSGVVKGCRR